MEYCDGGSLERLVKTQRPQEKECLYYFREIVAAFKYLVREKRMIHRDVKPENILINNGVMKLADFGFSREVLNEKSLKTITGTPIYSAPQILKGNSLLATFR